MNDFALGLMSAGILFLIIEIAWWTGVAIWLPRFIRRQLEGDE